MSSEEIETRTASFRKALKVEENPALEESNMDSVNEQAPLKSATPRATHIDLNEFNKQESWISEVDKDGDGVLRMDEIQQLVDVTEAAKRTGKILRTGFVALVVLVLLVLAVTVGLTFLAVDDALDDAPVAEGDGQLSTDETLVTAAVAASKVPMFILPVLNQSELEKIRMITVTLKNASFSPTYPAYDANDANPGDVEFGFQVAMYNKINTTFILFDDYIGNRLVVKNGVVEFKFAPKGLFEGDYRICASNVTCANTRLNGINLNETTILAQSELMKVSDTLDVSVYSVKSRSRRQMSATEFALTSIEFQTTNCITPEERAIFTGCLGVTVDTDQTCYLEERDCEDTAEDLLSKCSQQMQDDFQPVKECEGETITMIERLFQC